MILYHAHPISGEFVRSKPARPNPRTPGQFLIPAHAYQDAPGTPPAGMKMYRVGGAWVAKFPPVSGSGDNSPQVEILSMRQLLVGLTREGWITVSEGQGWLMRTGLPQSVNDLLDASYPDDHQGRFEAEAAMIAATEVRRDHPLVSALASVADKTEADIDSFFETYRVI